MVQNSTDEMIKLSMQWIDSAIPSIHPFNPSQSEISKERRWWGEVGEKRLMQWDFDTSCSDFEKQPHPTQALHQIISSICMLGSLNSHAHIYLFIFDIGERTIFQFAAA